MAINKEKCIVRRLKKYPKRKKMVTKPCTSVLSTYNGWKNSTRLMLSVLQSGGKKYNQNHDKDFVFSSTPWWTVIVASVGFAYTYSPTRISNNIYTSSCQQENRNEEPTTSSTAAKPTTTRMCGKWCATVEDESTPCLMDGSIIPCRGEFCITTAGLWNLFVLPRKNRPVTCEMYKDGLAYPLGAKPCDPACLIPEVYPKRYPLPTGLGVFCRPGTCRPGATPNPICSRFGTLECPCNWFGSECSNDWVAIHRLDRQWVGGGDQLLKVTLHVPENQWKTLITGWKPGGIVRLHYAPKKRKELKNIDNNTAITSCEEAPERHSNKIKQQSFAAQSTRQQEKREDAELYEMSCALASCDTPGQLEILVAPPDRSMRPEVRKIAEVLRSPSPPSSFHIQDLHVNPSISGFFNTRYEYLLQVLERNQSQIKNLVFVSSGAGLAGVLPAIEAIANLHPDVNIHLYHQFRDYTVLPYKSRLERLLQTRTVEMTLIETSPSRRDKESKYNEVFGTERGRPLLFAALRHGLKVKEELMFLNEGKKVYVQDVFQHDRFALSSTAVIVCGHLRVMNDLQDLLVSQSRQLQGKISGEDWMHERFFLNI